MRTTNSITDIPGIRVGHADDAEALTGCTIVLFPEGAVAGVDQRGGAPGTRETDLLHPLHLVQKVNAVLLTGGSAFGLDAAGGVVRYLEEHGAGYSVVTVKVPIVPAAVIFDLMVGRADVRPDAAMGYEACRRAGRGRPAEGNAGAGMGASVGKILGMGGAMKSGVGTASVEVGGGIVVGAIVVVNALGDVIDPITGQVIAGARVIRVGPMRLGGGGPFADTLAVMRSMVGRTALRLAAKSNTVIGVVATNAGLTKEGANIVARMAHDGIARAIRPAHTQLDGDTLFALSCGGKRADVSIVGAHAAEAVQQAVLRAVLAAEPAGGLPSARDFRQATGKWGARGGGDVPQGR
jgi:L-aminopeptidase/D-esterase-like protein